ncbi:hypothetical protein ACFXAZ_09970 [Streptomyces sp. NPDC059477]|uniref:hypothetical protein n=1 Tax=Streptomyces sp. NPDC059477 TaxID=3346847 RepID=UPI0036BF7CD2
MSENPNPEPVPLPPPLRILTENEWVGALSAAEPFIGTREPERTNVQYCIGAALGSLGLFRWPPRPANPVSCSAMKLIWQTETETDRTFLGAWLQCAEAPDHDSRHRSEDGTQPQWSDGVPGSMPAGPPYPWTA